MTVDVARTRKFDPSPEALAQYQRAVAASNLIHRRYPKAVRFDPSMERELRPKYFAALSYCGIAIEHHSAHLALVKQHFRTSAYALARPILDAVLRAGWAFCVASPEDIRKLAGGIEPSSNSMLKELKKIRPDLYEMLEPMKRQGWNVLSAYVHSGPQQLFEWSGDNRIAPSHPDEGLVEVLRFTTQLGLLAFAMMCEIAGIEDDDISKWLEEFYTAN